jgi:hypothetical protein
LGVYLPGSVRMSTFVSVYVSIAAVVFAILFVLFVSDRQTSITDRASWLVLILATIFWPITVPISLLELLDRKPLKTLDAKTVPIGQVLQQAGLLSPEQVQQVLDEQQRQPRPPRFGEILVRQGWIDRETIEFFVDRLPKLSLDTPKQKLGEYLQAAKLLNRQQVDEILAEQQQTRLKFGEVAVRKGWLKQQTLDSILPYLPPTKSVMQV